MDAGSNQQGGEETTLKAQELLLRRLKASKALSELSSPWWRRADPLVLAVIAGVLTLVGNMVVSIYNSRSNIAQEQLKAQDDLRIEQTKAKYNLVLQAMATNDTEVAKRNIHFFIDAGLLPDADCKIRDAIDQDQPVLPSLSGVAPATPAGMHSAPEIAMAYNFPDGYDGRGVTIGILEFGGAIDLGDLANYFSEMKLPVPNVKSISVDGSEPKPEPNIDIQVMEDVEIVGALAPAAHIRVYFGSFTHGGYARAIARATADGVSVLATGWGKPENVWGADEIKEVNSALENAARMHITVLAAVGNHGVTDGVDDGHPHVDFPASSPWVLAVGGTTLKSEGGTVTSEKVWRSVFASTGSGFSERFPRPDWQPVGLNQAIAGAGTGRGVPDVVASADPAIGTPVVVHGNQAPTGGTSVAVDIWAGLIARLNQALGYNVGFLNPSLYQDIGPGGLLHSIASGADDAGSVARSAARNAWSPVSGWGSPDGVKLLKWLREHPDAQLVHQAANPPCHPMTK